MYPTCFAGHTPITLATSRDGRWKKDIIKAYVRVLVSVEVELENKRRKVEESSCDVPKAWFSQLNERVFQSKLSYSVHKLNNSPLYGYSSSI